MKNDQVVEHIIGSIKEELLRRTKIDNRITF